MLERLLIAGLALLVPNQSHKLQNGEENVVPTGAVLIEKAYEEEIDQIKSAAVFHVVLLAISLTVCLAYGGILAYTHWTQKNDILGHIRNLVIALFCRIFFTVIFDGVVILGSDTSAEGRNTLVAFECISQNLVFAFWLMLTVYLHARIQRNFNSEPTLKLFEYGIPGAAIFFAFVSICSLPGEFYNKISFFFLSPLPLWLSASLRLLYLLIQLGLVADMGKMMMKTSLDNDSVSLLKKLLAVLVVLVFLFWLQFGFSIGRLPLKAASYYYFDFLIDGSQGGLVCLALYLFHKWVPTFLSTVPSTVTGIEERPKQTDEVLLRSGGGVLTVDTLFVKEDERIRKNSDPAAESRDVVYSSVVEPHRLQKTLELYKRLNVISKNQATVVEGEEFYDCLTRVSLDSEIGNSEKAEFQSIVSENSKPQPLPRKTSGIFKMSRTNENIQKKNAFYASKYLILEPKNLERRLSVASSGKGGMEETMDKKFSLGIDTVKSSEIVKKWLDDHSENLRAVGKPEIQPPCQEPTEKEKPPEKEAEPNQTEQNTSAASITPDAMLDLNKEESSSDQNTEIPPEAEVSPGKLSANNPPKVISVLSEMLDKSNHPSNKSDDYNSSDLTETLKTEMKQPKTNSDIIEEFHPSVRNPILIDNYNSPETNTYSEAGLNSEGGTCGENDYHSDNKTGLTPKDQLVPTDTSYTATDSKTGEDNFHLVNEKRELKSTSEQSLQECGPLHNSLVEETKQNIFC